MPVRSSDTMLSSPFDNMLDDIFDPKFIDEDFTDSLLSTHSDFDTCVNVDISDLVVVPSSPKYQIRHHDCMWSGTCIDKSHPNKKKGLINMCTVSTNSLTQESTSTSIQQKSSSISLSTIPTTSSSSTEAVKVISTKNIMTPKNIMTTLMCKNNKLSSGRSILINNNNLSKFNTNTTLPSQSKSSEIITSKDQCRSVDLESIMNSTIASLRPDTPLSLGDDVSELKTSIDLTPCPSSNRMKFSDPNSLKIINALAEHLEDSSSNLNECAPLISNFRNIRNTPSDLTEILQDITFLSDYEDACDDSSIIDIDDEYDENDYKETSSNQKFFSTTIKSQAMASARPTTHHEFISDHSYTRPKGSHYDIASLGVQTPSDSEEDIDVDTIIEKNLPTNPSARDRRALQTTVAHKFARSKNTSNRRRVSEDDSISSSTSTLSSKGSTPIKYGSQTPARYVSNNHSASSSSSISRKRQAPGHHHKDNNNNESKRFKFSKKLKLNQRHHHKAAAAAPIDQEELETIEKRNLHNNMERQRRIGLKNLFEELKCHIPVLKEKERAPKVNILREAAAYCTKLRREEEQYAELLKKHNRLLARVRNIKASIAQRRHY